MLFSATFSEDVQQLASLSLKSPVRLAADPTAAAPDTLSQEVSNMKGEKEREWLSLRQIERCQ
jgi:superfamily II DNA/RNA helicase